MHGSEPVRRLIAERVAGKVERGKAQLCRERLERWRQALQLVVAEIEPLEPLEVPERA